MALFIYNSTQYRQKFDFDIFVARQIWNETGTLASVTPSRDLYRQSNDLEKRHRREPRQVTFQWKEKQSEPKRYQSNKHLHVSGATIQSLRVSEGHLISIQMTDI